MAMDQSLQKRREVMSFEGTVINGTIVLDDGETLPEGARVEVVCKPIDDEPKTLRELLMKYAGCMTDLPADFAEQHDHYIHGTPKR
jgi:hypothetical protein